MMEIWTWFVSLTGDFIVLIDSIVLFGNVTLFRFFIGLFVFRRFLGFITQYMLGQQPGSSQDIQRMQSFRENIDIQRKDSKRRHAAAFIGPMPAPAAPTPRRSNDHYKEALRRRRDSRSKK